MPTLAASSTLAGTRTAKLMGPERLPKDLLYGQLAAGMRPTGRPYLRFKDACNRDLKGAVISLDQWEQVAEDRKEWRSAVKNGCPHAEEERLQLMEDKRQRRKASRSQTQSQTQPHGQVFYSFNPNSPYNNFICPKCNRLCQSRIG